MKNDLLLLCEEQEHRLLMNETFSYASSVTSVKWIFKIWKWIFSRRLPKLVGLIVVHLTVVQIFKSRSKQKTNQKGPTYNNRRWYLWSQERKCEALNESGITAESVLYQFSFSQREWMGNCYRYLASQGCWESYLYGSFPIKALSNTCHIHPFIYTFIHWWQGPLPCTLPTCWSSDTPLPNKSIPQYFHAQPFPQVQVWGSVSGPRIEPLALWLVGDPHFLLNAPNSWNGELEREVNGREIRTVSYITQSVINNNREDREIEKPTESRCLQIKK